MLFREIDITDSTSVQALKICCWLNTLEKMRFYRPFAGNEREGSAQKFHYFLPRLTPAITNTDSIPREEFNQEFRQVLSDLISVHAELFSKPDLSNFPVLHFAREYNKQVQSTHSQSKVDYFEAVSLVVISLLHPVHYYALFSATHFADWVLSVYRGNRYELECKYTSFVNLSSRKSLPRLDMAPLVRVVNQLEVKYKEKSLFSVPSAQADEDWVKIGVKDDSISENTSAKNLCNERVLCLWVADRMTDTGPLLRLEHPERHLTKAERYGNPFERPIHSSFIPKDTFCSVVQSFLHFGYKGLEENPEMRENLSWSQIQNFNRHIDWTVWNSSMNETYELVLK